MAPPVSDTHITWPSGVRSMPVGSSPDSSLEKTSVEMPEVKERLRMVWSYELVYT